MFIVKIDDKFVAACCAATRKINIGSNPTPEGEVRFRVLKWTVNPLDAVQFLDEESAFAASKALSYTYPSRVSLMSFKLEKQDF